MTSWQRAIVVFCRDIGMLAILLACFSNPANAQINDAVAAFNQAMRDAQKILTSKPLRRNKKSKPTRISAAPVPPPPTPHPGRVATKSPYSSRNNIASAKAKISQPQIPAPKLPKPKISQSPVVAAPATAVTANDAQPQEKKSPQPDIWSESKVASAQKACRKILSRINAVVEPVTPIKKGPCGDAAPVKLSALHGEHTVRFRPAATINCQMVLALDTWVRRGLQPLAQKHLGAPITTISVMSSYSCRNRYNKKKGRLSEHGKANALDIGGFYISNGARTDLLSHWGPTQRDIIAASKQAEIEASKSASSVSSSPALRAGELKQPAPASPYNQSVNKASPSPTSPNERMELEARTQIPLIQPVSLPLPERRPSLRKRHEWSKAKNKKRVQLQSQKQRQQHRDKFNDFLSLRKNLGGPKPPKSKSVDKNAGQTAESEKPLTNRAAFLRGAHRTACRIFGTVLGPEANDAHRNHFHVDLAPRRHKNYCR